MTGAAPPPLSAAVLAFLERDGWPVQQTSTQEAAVVESVFAGSAAEWPVRLMAYDGYGQLVVESLLPLAPAVPARGALAALVVGINWQLLTGAFQLDLATGEVRFRNTLLLVDNEVVTDRLIKGLLYSNVMTVDRCWPALTAVAVDGAEPQDVLAALEL